MTHIAFRHDNVLRRVFAACMLLLLVFATGPVHAEAGITLNFKDADIREVAATVGQITHKNFIIDPRVQGRVTVISSKPIDEDAVYAAFLSVLQVHGLAAVPAGSLIKIVPALEARQQPGNAYNNGTPGDAVVTQVVQVSNVSAAQLVPVLRPLMSTEAQLAAYTPANMLIISDRASNVTRLLHIIERIDQSTDKDIEIIPLQNASASDVAQVLTSLLQTSAAEGGPPLKLVADERSNSILVSGDKTDRLRVRALIAHLDMPQETGNTQVVYLHYAKAKDLADELKGYVNDLKQQAGGKGAAAGAAAGAGIGDVSVLPDERTNSLIITAPPKLMRSMEGVLAKLDIRRAQVFLQVIEAELTSDKSAELGVTWVADALNSGAAGLTDFSNTGTGIAGLAQGAAAASASGSGGVSTGISVPQGLTLGVGKIVSGGFSFAALLRALSGDSNTNILSTPSITTLDNQEADINVTQQIPFVTGQYTNTTGGIGTGGTATINPFQTVQRQDVGLQLKITPQINEGDSVHLKIDAEVSNLTGSSVGGQPVTNKRQIKTSVLAKDREIVVLGGLIDHDLIESEQRVPVLGSIPLLGNLFRYRKTTNTKRNLMVFIQPTILRDSESTRQYTNEQYKYLRELQMRNQGPVKLMPGEKRPMLDELQKSVTKPAAPTAGTTTVPAKAAPPTAATTAAPAAAQSVQHDPGH